MRTSRNHLAAAVLAAALTALTLAVAPAAHARTTPASMPTVVADTTPPHLVPMSAGFNDPNPHFTTNYATAWWQYADTESGVASTDTRIRSAAKGAITFGPYVYPRNWQADPGSVARPIPLIQKILTAGATYCVSTRARDIAGNVSPWSADVCTSTMGDEEGNALNGLSAGWRTTSNCTRYFSCSIMRSTTRGDFAIGTTGSEVSGRRFAFLVTTCSTCGRFAVYVGRTKLGVVDTYSPAKHDQQTIELPYHSYLRGLVTVVVVSSGKQVLIDAFGYRLN